MLVRWFCVLALFAGAWAVQAAERTPAIKHFEYKSSAKVGETYTMILTTSSTQPLYSFFTDYVNKLDGYFLADKIEYIGNGKYQATFTFTQTGVHWIYFWVKNSDDGGREYVKRVVVK